MPRVRPLSKPDPINVKIAREIGAVMIIEGMTIGELSKRTGISPATLARRIGTHGDLDSLKLWEYKAIRKVGEQLGVIDKGE